MKKVLSLILVFAMVICFVPAFSASVTADDIPTVSIGSAAELAAFIADVNSGAKPENTNATLTADIDLSSYSGENTWTPLKKYSGVFDGLGHSISGLTLTRRMADGTLKNDGTDYQNTELGNGCFGQYSYGVFAVEFNGTMLDVVFEDIALTAVFTQRRNVRVDFAIIAGKTAGASFINVDTVNTDITINKEANDNQGFIAYSAVYVARATGTVLFKNCEGDETSVINNLSARVEAAQVLGIYEGTGSFTFDTVMSKAVVNTFGDTVPTVKGTGAGWLTASGVAGGLYKTTTGVAPTYKYTEGLNATFWGSTADGNESGHYDSYVNIIGMQDRGATTDYTQNRKFGASINQLLKISKKTVAAGDARTFGEGYDSNSYKAATGINSDNEYIAHWSGTITATTAGTYYFVANKVDNGCVIFVDGAKAFEYWGAGHWFDNDNDRLVSEYSFEMAAGETKPVEIWYLEIDGGEALSFLARNGADGAVTDFGTLGISFSLSLEYYTSLIKYEEHDEINALLPFGVGSNGLTMTDSTESNGSPADNPGNQNYTPENLAALKACMLELGSCVVPDYESFSYGYRFGMLGDDFIAEYNGYITPSTTGSYTFGTSEVDNCFFVEIIDPATGLATTVYNFWAKKIWNSIVEAPTYHSSSIDLEADKSYIVHAVFLEINGGEAVQSSIKIDGGEAKSLAASGLKFTTTPVYEAVAATSEYYVDLNSGWYTRTSAADDAPESWNTSADVYKTWSQVNAPFDNTEKWPVATAPYLWVAKEFTVADINAIEDWAIMCSLAFDDDIRVYINSTLVFSAATWGNKTMKLADNTDLLVEGTNVVSASLHQHYGGYNFNMSLYSTCEDTSGYAPMIAYIGDADELISYIATVNKMGAVFTTLNITADMDFEGKTWVPFLGQYRGTVNGNGHVLSNITYTSAATGGPVGIIAHELSNMNDCLEYGKVFDLTLRNCTVSATQTTGVVGGIAGLVDRAAIDNCTVENITVTGKGYAGAIAGRAIWSIVELNELGDGRVDAGYVCISNCTVNGATVTAATIAAGIAARTNDGGDTPVKLGNTVIYKDTLTLTSAKCEMFVGENPALASFGEDTTVCSTISPEAERNYSFYQQTRQGEDGTTDYRIIVVVKESWLAAHDTQASNAYISFVNGTDIKTVNAGTTKAYATIEATGDGYTDQYTSAEGTVIFGWIVTGVPSGYTLSAADFMAV